MSGGVWGMIGSRLLQMLVVLLLASFVIFLLLQLVPGDPAVALAGDQATDERLQEIRLLYGFDQPIVVQYWHWLKGAVTGDLARSLQSNQDVTVLLAQHFPNSLTVAFAATLLSVLIGAPLGLLAAYYRDSPVDGITKTVSSLGVATPNFWLAMVLVSTFALSLRWFPATGLSASFSDPLRLLQQLALPSIALAATGIAIVARQMRAALIEVLSSQYVRTLYAKGLPVSLIVWKHGMRNVAVKMLTIVGLTFNHLLGASVVVETVFAVPGMGTLVINGVLNKDFPVVQGVIIAMVVAVIVVNCVVDILCAIVDPRLSIRA